MWLSLIQSFHSWLIMFAFFTFNLGFGPRDAIWAVTCQQLPCHFHHCSPLLNSTIFLGIKLEILFSILNWCEMTLSWMVFRWGIWLLIHICTHPFVQIIWYYCTLSLGSKFMLLWIWWHFLMSKTHELTKGSLVWIQCWWCCHWHDLIQMAAQKYCDAILGGFVTCFFYCKNT